LSPASAMSFARSRSH